MKYNQKLPAAVEKKLDAYIERIKKIDWFKPKKLDKTAVEKQIKVALEAFGVKASIEYRSLKTEEDWDAAWDAARDAAWGAAWDAARDAAWDAAWGAAWDAAWGAAWDAARDAARDAAWGACDLLAALSKDTSYLEKYPQGNFLQLVPLWELGLYPVGVVEGKFVVYVPDVPEGNVLLDIQEAEIVPPTTHKHMILDGIEYDLIPREENS